MIWLSLSAAFMTVSAVVHGILGERRLLQPLLKNRDGILGADQARKIFRLAWHALSLLMLLSAASVMWTGTPRGLIMLIGLVWVAVGLVDAVYTRGRHIAWPFLSAAGIFALLGAMA